MSEPEPRPDTTTEQWIYGGMRLSTKDKKLGEWVDPNGKALLFKYKGGYITGCLYEVAVRRTEASVFMVGEPRFVGRSEDVDLIRQLAAEEKGHEQDLAVLQRMRRAKEANPFDEAIDQVAKLIQHLPAPQRPGVIAYVLHRLSRSWRS